MLGWDGNELQGEAFEKLYEVYEKIERCEDHKLLTDWKYLIITYETLAGYSFFAHRVTKVAQAGQQLHDIIQIAAKGHGRIT